MSLTLQTLHCDHQEPARAVSVQQHPQNSGGCAKSPQGQQSQETFVLIIRYAGIAANDSSTGALCKAFITGSLHGHKAMLGQPVLTVLLIIPCLDRFPCLVGPHKGYATFTLLLESAAMSYSRAFCAMLFLSEGVFQQRE